MTIFAHGYIFFRKTKITKRADTSWEVSALIYFVWKSYTGQQYLILVANTFSSESPWGSAGCRDCNRRFFIRFLPFPPCPSTPPQFCYIVTCYNKVVPHVAQPSFALTARVALSPRLFQPFQPFHISSMHLTEEPLEHNYVVCRIYLSLCSERLWSLDNMLYCHGLMQLCR